jgi:hypothetical protein
VLVLEQETGLVLVLEQETGLVLVLEQDTGLVGPTIVVLRLLQNRNNVSSYRSVLQF